MARCSLFKVEGCFRFIHNSSRHPPSHHPSHHLLSHYLLYTPAPIYTLYSQPLKKTAADCWNVWFNNVSCSDERASKTCAKMLLCLFGQPPSLQYEWWESVFWENIAATETECNNTLLPPIIIECMAILVQPSSCTITCRISHHL